MLQSSTELICELAAIEFNAGRNIFTTVGLYRPTSGTVNDFLVHVDKFLSTLSTKLQKILIKGDINIDSSKDSLENARLNNTLQQHNLNIIQTAPTRITHATSTTIDCCITNINSVTVSV